MDVHPKNHHEGAFEREVEVEKSKHPFQGNFKLFSREKKSVLLQTAEDRS
jgi:hypothetical protein